MLYRDLSAPLGMKKYGNIRFMLSKRCREI